MTELTVTAARSELSHVVDQARTEHEPVYLTKHGRRVAAVIDAQQLERLVEAAEDLEDIRAAAQARAEADAPDGAVPWEQVKADLGML